MNIFLIDADNLLLAAWIEDACRSLESSVGSLAAVYGSVDNLKGLKQTILKWTIPRIASEKTG